MGKVHQLCYKTIHCFFSSCVQGIEFSLPLVEDSRTRKQKNSEVNLEMEVANSLEVGNSMEEGEYVISLLPR